MVSQWQPWCDHQQIAVVAHNLHLSAVMKFKKRWHKPSKGKFCLKKRVEFWWLVSECLQTCHHPQCNQPAITSRFLVHHLLCNQFHPDTLQQPPARLCQPIGEYSTYFSLATRGGQQASDGTVLLIPGERTPNPKAVLIQNRNLLQCSIKMAF